MPPRPTPLRADRWTWWLLLLLLAAAYVLVSPALKPGGFASREPTGFYGWLTEAFSLGQTHLTIEPDPRLRSLQNPWAAYQGVPRLHDATYFEGHYYLYFGPTAAIFPGLPWRWLTGTYL